MRFRVTFDDLRTLVTPPIIRRGVAAGGLGLVERILAPAAAWSLFGHGGLAKIAWFAALGAAFTVRSLAQRAWAARAEAELVERVVESVLHGDTLASAVADDDSRLQVIQAVYQSAQCLAQTLPNLAADLVACVVLGVLVVAKEPGHLVAMAGGLTLAAGATLLLSRHRVERAVEEAWKVQAQVYANLAHALEGRLEIVGSGFRGRFVDRLRVHTSRWADAGVRVAAATTLSGRVPMLAIAGLVAAALLMQGSVRWAASLADVALFASVTPAFAGVAQGLHGLARSERWVQIVATVVRSARGPVGGTQALAVRLAPRIQFESVSFRYDASKQTGAALDGVNLQCEGAGTLGLSGANGSGKSTCLRLLLGLALPSEGSVRIGGVPLGEIDLDAWRRNIAFLPQRPYLPPRADVRQAVGWIAPETTDDSMLRALDRVGLLSALRRAAADPLSVRVDALSVGERQRVALARLLCRDAPLYVLDEPDANLDRAGIALVAQVIRELGQRGRVVFAAHTPELLAVADVVITLDGGRVVNA
jgi:ABC-type bacteriocin/lantibiotic exporter with double-glycine peptidase domain